VYAYCTGTNPTCGHLAGSCICSTSGLTCDPEGSKCGPGLLGTCGGCSPIRCVGEYGVPCSGSSQTDCSDPCGGAMCVEDGGCYWINDTSTPTPTPCNPGATTCGECSGGTRSCTNGCDTWPEACPTPPPITPTPGSCAHCTWCTTVGCGDCSADPATSCYRCECSGACSTGGGYASCGAVYDASCCSSTPTPIPTCVPVSPCMSDTDCCGSTCNLNGTCGGGGGPTPTGAPPYCIPGGSHCTNTPPILYRCCSGYYCDTVQEVCKVSPTCNLRLPPTATIIINQSLLFTASVTNIQNGTVSDVIFYTSRQRTPEGDEIAEANPTTDTSVPYETQVRAYGSPGSTTLTASAIMNGVSGCSGTSTVNVKLPGLWWQVKDGDVTTNGDLNSDVPSGKYFELPGSGEFPGIPAYGASTNLIGANVSQTYNWIANSAYSSTKTYNSSFFINAIPAGTTINYLGSSIDGTALTSGTATSGIYWDEYDAAANGGVDLTINTAASLAGKKVILIVKGANVNLKGKISLNDGYGFFMLVASGNIVIDPGLGGGSSPNLEGIFVTDGQFQTGAAATQLWVRGSIVSYGEINLQRDLGDSNSTTPAELFEYAPDLEFLFPSKLATHNLSWQEVAP
jgi:hypothetical protein